MASFCFNAGAELLATAGTNWTSSTIKAALISASATPDKDHTAMSTYTATRIGSDQTLSGSKTIYKNTTDDRTEYQCDAGPTWTAVAAGSTVAYVIVYKFVTDDAGSTPLFLIDVTNTATNGGNVTLTFPSNVVGYQQQ